MWPSQNISTLKFIFSKKATEIDEIFIEIFGFSQVWADKPEILLIQTRSDPDPMIGEGGLKIQEKNGLTSFIDGYLKY